MTLLPIVVFGWYWAQLAVNVPKWDDHALKFYLLANEQEPTLWGKLYQLFKQHNEHRIVLDRLATWVDFNVFGKLNYLHLMVLGNATLLGVLWIFGKTFRNSLLHLSPIAFLLFNLASWENSFWGMAAVQNFGVVLWVVWAIYQLSFTKNLTGAIILAIIATMTSGNGLLIWPIGAVLLGLQQRFKPLIYWLVSTLIVIGLYFVGYEKPAGNPPDRGSITDLLKGWLAFNGAAGEVIPFGNPFTNSLLLGTILTIGLMAVGIWFLYKQLRAFQPLWRTDPASNRFGGPIQNFALGILAFILGTAMIVAWSRVGFGLETLITSRYKIYSLTLLCLGYVLALSLLRDRWKPIIAGIGLIGSVTIAGLSYLTFSDEVLWWRRWLLTNQQFNWTYLTNQPVSGIDPTTARWIDNAPAFYDRCLSTMFQPINQAVQPITLDTVYQAGGQFIIRSRTEQIQGAPQPSILHPDDGFTLMLQSEKRTYLNGALPTPAGNALTVLRRGIYPTRDLLATFPADEPDPGLYRLSLLQYQAATGTCVVVPTNRTVVVKPGGRTELKKNW